MSGIILGQIATMKLGKTAAGLVVVSGDGTGFSGFGLEQPVDVRRVPARAGISAQQRGRFHTYAWAFTVYQNSITAPLLRAGNGQRLFYEAYLGLTGRTYAGDGIVTVSKLTDIAQNVVSYRVRLDADGAPTVT